MNLLFNNTRAIATVHGGEGAPDLYGVVKFYQKVDCVLVTARIIGLPDNESGFYGFHIHEGDSCAGNAFSDSGSHYNPSNTPHPKHAGDLPPLMRCGNTANLEVTTDRFKVSDIIGKTVIIHSAPDDFTTQPSGNAGAKIACGVIERR